MLETDSSSPSSSPILSSTPLCFVFQLSGQQRQRRAGSAALSDTFPWHPLSRHPTSLGSALLSFFSAFHHFFVSPRPVPDKGQLFHGDNLNSSLTTASGDRVWVMKNRSISCIHTSHVIEACNHSVASTCGELELWSLTDTSNNAKLIF